MATLPQFVKTIDNAFTQTWYDIQPEAENQILLATVVWAWLKLKGCFDTQMGGKTIERTVKYALPPTMSVVKGDILNGSEIENRTAAFWTFRYLSTSILRSLQDDRENRGTYQIVNYVSDRTEDAMDALRQQYEKDIQRAGVTDESGREIQGLNDMIPTVANRATGTYGGIARPTTFASDLPTVGNTWWTPKYAQLTANPDVNLLSDMKHFKNTVEEQLETVDGILTTQTLYETYEEFGLDASQIVGNSKLLDLGFTTLKFKGADMFWSPNSDSGSMKFLTSKYIDIVYDPMVWFSMGPWLQPPNMLERIAHILCCLNMVPGKKSKVALRFHGLLYT